MHKSQAPVYFRRVSEVFEDNIGRTSDIGNISADAQPMSGRT